MPIPAKKSYQDLVDRLVSTNRPDVKVSKYAGIPAVTWRGRAFAGLAGEALAVRLDPAALTKAAQLKGARPLIAASGPLPEWICVPMVHVGHWRRLTEDALYYAGKS